MTRQERSLRKALTDGFTYINVKTWTFLGGEDGSREVTGNVRRIKDVLDEIPKTPDFAEAVNACWPTPGVLQIVLKDNNSEHEPQRTVKVEVSLVNGFLEIRPEGYGAFGVEKGAPVCLEIWDGELRVHLWDDINVEDPKTFPLENAREELAKEIA